MTPSRQNYGELLSHRACSFRRCTHAPARVISAISPFNCAILLFSRSRWAIRSESQIFFFAYTLLYKLTIALGAWIFRFGCTAGDELHRVYTRITCRKLHSNERALLDICGYFKSKEGKITVIHSLLHTTSLYAVIEVVKAPWSFHNILYKHYNIPRNLSRIGIQPTKQPQDCRIKASSEHTTIGSSSQHTHVKLNKSAPQPTILTHT